MTVLDGPSDDVKNHKTTPSISTVFAPAKTGTLALPAGPRYCAARTPGVRVRKLIAVWGIAGVVALVGRALWRLLSGAP